MVIVFDDVSPLIRAQKVAAWREVARRLAHEIKNPLTPIQLCAERLRRHLQQRARADARAGRGVHDDDRRRGRIAEGRWSTSSRSSRACRRRVRCRPTCTHCWTTRWRSIAGCSPDVDIRRRFAAALPKVSVDPEQIRRVMINLIDNAIEAMDRQRRRSRSRRSTIRPNNLVRIVVADDGPGIPAAGARQAVPAVLLDQAARQRPRPGHRPPHRRRAWRQHRRRPTTRREARASPSNCLLPDAIDPDR